MSCTATAARSFGEPVTAILNLRGRYENSGCRNEYWRSSSQYGRGSASSSFARPAYWSDVMLRTQLPDDWIDVISDVGERLDDVRRLLELDPVVLDVLARREVAEVLVVLARDVREAAHLLRRQRAVRHVDAQHVGVQLQIEAVHEPQRPELVLGELAREPPLHLAAKLRGALGDELCVEFIVSIHRLLPILWCSGARGWHPRIVGRPRARCRAIGVASTSVRSVRTVGPKARITSRISVGRTWPFSTLTWISIGSMTRQRASCCFATPSRRCASASSSTTAPAAIAGSHASPGAKNTTTPSTRRFAMIICGIRQVRGRFGKAAILHGRLGRAVRPKRDPRL